MKFILSLDQGTTSSRAIVFDHKGQIVSLAQEEFRQIYPRPAWVEHDAEEIWETQVAVARAALDRAGLRAEDVAAIGIANQRETTVLWDRESGRPIHNAVVWQDRRTAGYCDQLREEGLEERFRQKTGLVLDAYFSGTKLRWLLDNCEGARDLARAGRLAFGTIDSWLVWNLTKGSCHVTDVSNASRTLLFNIHSLEWDEEILQILDIPYSVLPEVRASSEVYSETTLFSGQIPVAGIAGDQQAALFGQVCTSPGMVKNTYGTGCFLVMNTGKSPIASDNKLLTTIAWQIGNEVDYALEGSVFIGGAAVQWLRDGLGIISESSEVGPLAESVSDSGGIYLVPAFAGLGAPHWDQYARGLLIGLTRDTNAGHLARAALEGIAYQVAEVVRAMESDSGFRLRELRVDGGAAVNDLLVQFQTDLLGVSVLRPRVSETTALGAAYLAGLAVGYWGDIDSISSHWQLDRRFDPEMERDESDRLLAGWSRAVQRARSWIDD